MEAAPFSSVHDDGFGSSKSKRKPAKKAERGAKSTNLARSRDNQNLSGAKALPASVVSAAALQPSCITSVVIPDDLQEWATSDTCQEVLLSVKEKAVAYALRVEAQDDGRKCVVVSSPGQKEAAIARALLSTHFMNQLDLLRLAARSVSRRHDVSALHLEISSGLRVQFEVNEAFVGMLIGRGGSRIKEVQETTGCEVCITNNRHCSITGPTTESVRMARELMEFVEEVVPVEPWQAVLLRRSVDKLAAISRDSGRTLVRAVDDAVHLVGTRSGVASAKMLLEVTLAYLRQRAAILEADQELSAKLHDLRVGYGGQRRGDGRQWQARGRGERNGCAANNDGSVDDAAQTAAREGEQEQEQLQEEQPREQRQQPRRQRQQRRGNERQGQQQGSPPQQQQQEELQEEQGRGRQNQQQRQPPSQAPEAADAQSAGGKQRQKRQPRRANQNQAAAAAPAPPSQQQGQQLQQFEPVEVKVQEKQNWADSPVDSPVEAPLVQQKKRRQRSRKRAEP